MRAFTAVMAASLLLLAACDTSSVLSEQDPAPQLISFEVGTQWIFERQRTDEDGGVISTRTDTLAVVQAFEHEQEQWIQIGSEAAATNCVAGFYVQRPDGYFRSLTDPREPDAEARLFFKYPAAVGDTYVWPSSGDPDIGIGPTQISVVSLDAPVQTGEGVVLSHQYRLEVDSFFAGGSWHDVEDGVYDFYLAPEVGFTSFSSLYLSRRDGQFVPVGMNEWTLISFVPAESSLN